MRGKWRGIRVAVVGVGYWGMQHVRVLRSTTGVATVTGVDQRFTRIGNESQEIDMGVTVYPAIEDALPHLDAAYLRLDCADLGVQANIHTQRPSARSVAPGLAAAGTSVG